MTDRGAAALLDDLARRGVAGAAVLAALASVPRDRFVPATFQGHAWDNVALPIGQGQTVSQPEVVAIMTEALCLTDRHKVLEIGTGSGFQTAILARLCRRVYTIERHLPLLREAEARLAELGLNNVTTRHGDGAAGWREQAPFDRIMVTAAAEREVPRALLDHLAIDGLMIVPIARSAIDQRLVAVRRTEDGFESADLGAVRFVPLVSELPTGDPADGPEPVTRALARLRRAR